MIAYGLSGLRIMNIYKFDGGIILNVGLGKENGYAKVFWLNNYSIYNSGEKYNNNFELMNHLEVGDLVNIPKATIKLVHGVYKGTKTTELTITTNYLEKSSVDSKNKSNNKQETKEQKLNVDDDLQIIDKTNQQETQDIDKELEQKILEWENDL